MSGFLLSGPSVDHSQVVARKVGSIQWLRDSSPDVFHNFYQLARGMNSGQIEALCKRQVSFSHQKQWGWAADGAYKPLSVWAKDGYDVKDIEEKALPEDRKIDPTYGWELFRVRVQTSHEGESWKHTDGLSLLAKCRTRALKRRMTDESEKLAGKDPSAASFSSESSGGSSEDEQDKRKGGKNRKGGKAKARAKPEDKAKAKVRVAAKAAAKSKVGPALASLRAAIANPLILDLEESTVGNMREKVRILTALDKSIRKATTDGIDEFTATLESFDFKACKQAEKDLKKQLSKLEKQRK